MRAIGDRLLDVAASQHGCVTTEQIRAAGASRGAQARWVCAGVLVAMGRGVSAVAGLTDPFTPVAALQLGHPAVVAERRTAAAAWGLAGAREGGAVELDLVVPRSLRIRRRDGPVLRAFDLPDRAIGATRGLAVTTPTWTLGELGAAPGVDADRVELAVESALHLELTTEAKLRSVLDRRRGEPWPGTPVLAEALRRRPAGAPPTGSYAETRFLQRVVRPAGLEEPERQVPFGAPGQRRAYRADFVFRRGGAALDVEIDGGADHGTSTAHDHDTRRDHVARLSGYTVVRFTAWRVDRRSADVRRCLLAELARLGSGA